MPFPTRIVICLIILFLSSSKTSSAQHNVHSNISNSALLSLNDELLEACKKQNFEKVKTLLLQGADINCMDKNSFTPLNIAAFNRDIKCINLLVTNHANINLPDYKNRSPLLNYINECCRLNVITPQDTECIEFLLKEKAHHNQKDIYGNTALSIVLRKNVKFIPIAEILINAGADPHIDSKWRNNAFETALVQNKFELVKLMVKNKANIEFRNYRGQTPLMIAIDYFNTKAAQLMIELGATINTEDTNGNTPLMYTAIHNNLEIAKNLISKGADVKRKNKEGFDALFHAVNSKHANFALFLIQHGAFVNTINKQGKSALMHAAYMNYDEVLKVLINHNANIEQTDYNGNTALFYTTCFDCVNTLQILLDNKANINHENNNKNNFIHCLCGRILMTEGDILLLDYTCKDMFSVLKNEHIKIPLNSKNVFGDTPLILAANIGNTECAEHLIKERASLNNKNNLGITALSCAVAFNHEAMVDLLLAHHAKVNITDNKKNTPLHFACAYQRPEKYKRTEEDFSINYNIVQKLIKAGAKIKALNHKGISPLMFANEYNKIKCTELLISNGA